MWRQALLLWIDKRRHPGGSIREVMIATNHVHFKRYCCRLHDISKRKKKSCRCEDKNGHILDFARTKSAAAFLATHGKVRAVPLRAPHRINVARAQGHRHWLLMRYATAHGSGGGVTYNHTSFCCTLHMSRKHNLLAGGYSGDCGK